MKPVLIPSQYPSRMTPDDIAHHDRWHLASGHPGGWRVVRGYSPIQELEGKTGNRILFRSIEAAQKRADQLNSP